MSEANNILKRVDEVSKQDINYLETTVYHDGTPITDNKCDGVVFRKKGNLFYVKADFLFNKTVKLSSYIPTDGIMHPISEIFPDVTLVEVQAILPTATLNSSAGWYALSKLMKWIPKNGIIDIDCDLRVDEEIVIDRSFIKFTSSGLWTNRIDANPYLSRKVAVRQTSTGKDVFAIVDGNGVYHSAGYVEGVYFENFDVLHTDYTGDGFSFTHSSSGTSIGIFFKNIVVAACRYGVIKNSGHINNVYFNDCGIHGNYNIGLKFPSGNNGQTNYIVMHNVGFDSNGLDTVNGQIVNYTQVSGQENYEKGGCFIEGTAIYLHDVGGQVNHGFGLMFGNYILGGTATGYFEQNPLGDFVCLSNDINAFQNVIVNIYSNANSYIVPNELIRNKIIPQYSAINNRKLATQSFSRNLVKNAIIPNSLNGWNAELTKTINSEGIAEIEFISGLTYFFPEMEKYAPKKGDLLSVSFEIFATNLADIDFGPALDINDNTIFVSQLTSTVNEWVRISTIIQVKEDSVNNLFFIRKYGSASSFKIRKLSINKLEDTNKSFFQFDQIKTMPNQPLSTATDVAGTVADLNALISKIIASGAMSSE